ncbi:MAG: hypothetical protein HY822_20545 [Acidobacteria bacterium]|nr:hypothetical protein [Acidobacteriota bacterium]
MRAQLPVAAVIAALTLAGFFQFPGHTYLQSDTQIYLPMFERLENPQVLAKDLVATRPHMAFTIYDEVSLGLRKLTGADFQHVLAAQQLLFRALGILGAFLIATSLGLGRWPALAVAALFSLGATVLGPMVLTFEYEPVPRGFALPLLVFAIGLAAHGRDLGAGAAASLAFLYHPPTTFVFWAVYSALTLWPTRPDWMIRRIRGLAPLAAAVLIMFALSRLHTGAAEQQVLFSRIDPAWEQLQRMRAPYDWVSLWIGGLWLQYAILWLVSAAAAWRLRASLSPELRFFALGMPLAGVLSVPASYLLLERMKLALIPQFQPARAILFITVFAVLMAAAAGIGAAARGRLWEAVLWLLPAFAVPASSRLMELLRPDLANPSIVRRLVLVAGCAAAMACAARWRRFAPAVMLVAVAAFWLVPGVGGVENYPRLDSPELRQLAEWARRSTPQDAVFLFPDAGRELYPGVFRARAVRAVWVCWKSGGQVNFMRGLALEWGARWRQVMAKKLDYSVVDYRSLGVDFVVLKPAHRLPGRTPVYENPSHLVYAP